MFRERCLTKPWKLSSCQVKEALQSWPQVLLMLTMKWQDLGGEVAGGEA